jgi:hypothetical protein
MRHISTVCAVVVLFVGLSPISRSAKPEAAVEKPEVSVVEGVPVRLESTLTRDVSYIFTFKIQKVLGGKFRNSTAQFMLTDDAMWKLLRALLPEGGTPRERHEFPEAKVYVLELRTPPTYRDHPVNAELVSWSVKNKERTEPPPGN